jgi:hypothetical protein
MQTVSMTKITKLLNESGVKAQFCMSGGNCGTIYIGETDAEGYAEFAVGPSNYSLDEAWTDICWGKDDCGESDPYFFENYNVEFTEENVAKLIIADYNKSKVGA